jgi:hypothetical protein
VIIIAFALLGAITGALTAAIVLAVDFEEKSLYVVPGVVFSVAFAIVLWQRWRLSPARALAYVVAVSLANAAAVFVALAIANGMVTNFAGGDVAGNAVTGIVAGAVGAGLATGGTALLIATTRRVWPIAVGAFLGALLPVAYLGEYSGLVVFYMVWQAGFAAATAATLPPLK